MQDNKRKPFRRYRLIYSEHASKLHQRYQNHAQFLEDLKIFAQQKSIIEKIYCQSICKLVQQTFAKYKVSHSHQFQSLSNAWFHFLNSIEISAKERTKVADILINNVVEVCKLSKIPKTQTAKQANDGLIEVQREVLQSLQSLKKSRRVYAELQNQTTVAKTKLDEVEERLKKKSLGIFESHAKIQQQFNKVSVKLKDAMCRSTYSRNQYILNLISTNALQTYYFQDELQHFINMVDETYYDSCNKFLTTMVNSEIESASKTVKLYSTTIDKISQISVVKDSQLFIDENHFFSDMFLQEFEPQDGDNESGLLMEHDGDIELNRVAEGLALQVVRQCKLIESNEKKLQKLNYPNDLSIVAIQLKEINRRTESNKVRCQAQLDALKKIGIEVDKMVESAIASFETTAMDDIVKNIISDEPIDLSLSQTELSIPSIVLYSYEALKADELTIFEGEKVELLGQEDSDGWILARNTNGMRGMIPMNYVTQEIYSDGDNEIVKDMLNRDLSKSSSSIDSFAFKAARQQSLDATQCSQSEWKINKEDCDYKKTQYLSYDALPTVKMEEGDDLNTVHLLPISVRQNSLNDGSGYLVRAIYDYEGVTMEELSFVEGQIIKVLNSATGIDDGWLQGKLMGDEEGRIGIFPSLIVEPIEMSEIIVNDDVFEASQDELVVSSNPKLFKNNNLISPTSIMSDETNNQSIDLSLTLPPRPKSVLYPGDIESYI